MSKEFKYKDFVNMLRFQVGGLVSDEFYEDGEKYIKSFVYSQSLKTAEALYNNASVKVQACEVITQYIAEWTFHKVIDLLNGGIAISFHTIVINKINAAIFDYLIEENAVNEFNYDNCTDEELKVSVENIVKVAYQKALAQIYSDKGIDKDTYLDALQQSHIDDYSNDLNSESSEESVILKDEFVNIRKKKFSYIQIIKEEKLFISLYIVVILLVFIACTVAARHSDILLINLFGIIIIFPLIAGLCKHAVDETVSICSQNTKQLEIEIDEMKDFINPNRMYERLGVDILCFQMGEKLVDFCDPDSKNGLLPLVALLRKNLTDELGFIIPNLRCMDNSKYKPYECGIYIRNVRRDTFYIKPNTKDEEIIEIITSRLRKCFIKYANDIISKTDVLKLMELVRSQNPTLINDLIPELISAIDFRRIMVNLIKEEVPIKDIILIFERLCDFARFNKEPEILTARLRAELAPQICSRISVNENGENVLYAITLSEDWENILINSLVKTELGSMFKLDTETVSNFIKAFNSVFDNLQEHKNDVVIIVIPSIRKTLFDFLSVHFDEIKVMSYNELDGDIRVEKLSDV